MSSFGRQRENIYFSSFIEVTETGLEMSFESTWISNLSSDKKIGIRRIVTEVDPDSDYPFNLQICHSIKQGNWYEINNIQISGNFGKQRIPDIYQG